MIKKPLKIRKMIHPEQVGNSLDFSSQIKEKALGAKLSSKSINNLPDSDFAYIAPGGEKDSGGKNHPAFLTPSPYSRCCTCEERFSAP